MADPTPKARAPTYTPKGCDKRKVQEIESSENTKGGKQRYLFLIMIHKNPLEQQDLHKIGNSKIFWESNIQVSIQGTPQVLNMTP